MAHILVIEDEAAIAMALQGALSDEGHEVATAADGLQGLASLGQSPLPDIVLVDLLMPRAGGRVVVETMRADPRLQSIPVVLITGAARDTEAFPPAGSYQALIFKPFDLFDVVDRVHLLLETSRQF